MAELDTQRVLQIDAQQAETTLASLRTALKEARAELNTLTVGSDDYKAKLKEVEAAQNSLTNATKVGTAELRSAEDVLADSNASYNELSRTMSQLKQEWKTTSDEVKRAQLGQQIAAANDRLKKMDESVGVFSRNVGDYKNQMVGAFQSVAGSAGAMINPVKNVTMGLQVMSKTPVIFVLGMLARLIMSVVDALKTSEDNLGRTSKAMSSFNAIGTVITRGLQALGGAVGWVAEKLGGLLEKIGVLKEETEEQKRLQQDEIDLIKERRRVNEANAESELKISKLRKDAADKINLSAKERLALIKQAADEELAISQRNVELAKRELKLLEDRAALTQNSVEDNDRLSEARVRVFNAEAAYNNKMREYNAQMAEANNQAIRDQKALQAAIEGTTAALEVQQEMLEERIKRRTKYEKQWREELLAIEEEFAENYEEGLAALAAGEEKYTAEVKANEEARLAAVKANEEARLANEEARLAAKQKQLSVASQIAENASEIAGKQTTVGKSLAVASATIDTYQSAVAAYKSMVGIPFVGPGLAAAAAAAAITAGMANVKSILAVDTSGRSTTMGTGANRVSVSNYAPAVVQQVPLVRQLTNAAQEETLNRIAQNTSATAQNTGGGQPIKAYVVLSELEAKQNYSNRREQETTF